MGRTLQALTLLSLLGCGGGQKIHVVVSNQSPGQIWVDCFHLDRFGGPVDAGQVGEFQAHEEGSEGLTVKVYRVSDQFLLFDGEWPPGLVQETTSITVH